MTDMTDEEFFATLPAGFRFKPSDQLLLDYLASKTKDEPLPRIRIHVVDLFDFSPEDLAGFEKATGVDAWYFFTRTDGSWVEKVARDGIWKAAGDEAIEEHGEEIGYKKEAVFFRGENGVETDWLMSEFRLKKAVQAAENNTRLEDWVLCKLSKKTEA